MQSDYDYCKVLNERTKYVEFLDPLEVRFHTYHFDGDFYFGYNYGWEKKFRENQWRTLIKNVPPKYVISEPPPSFGYVIDDRMFNINTINYQLVIKDLWGSGVFSELENLENPHILEIGAGHGQLVYHLKQIMPRAMFTIIDLPASLMFSKKYLPYHLKNQIRDVAFYDNEEYKDANIGDFDLAISNHVFNATTDDQTREYAEFISKHLRGKFYTSNADVSLANPQGTNVSKILSEFFDIAIEIPVERGSEARGNFLSRLMEISPRKVLARFKGRSFDPEFANHHRLYQKKKF